MIKTRINGKLIKGKSVINIFSRLLQRPLHRVEDKNLLMVDVQKSLLKKRYGEHQVHDHRRPPGAARRRGAHRAVHPGRRAGLRRRVGRGASLPTHFFLLALP